MGKVTEFFQACKSQDQMELVKQFANAAVSLHLNGFDVVALAEDVASDPDGSLDETVALQDRLALYPVAEGIGGKAFADAVIAFAGEMKDGEPEPKAVTRIAETFRKERRAEVAALEAEDTGFPADILKEIPEVQI